MLVYVNNFKCLGINSFQKVILSIHGWLNKKSTCDISTNDLLKNNNFEFENSFIRTYTADKAEPKTYSVMYTHPDKKVSGRQWITEIGIVKNKDHTFVTILLEISDVSTFVNNHPIATRPSLISYLKLNCELDSKTIGISPIEIDNNELCDLKEEIFRDTRKYPIVCISKYNKEYLTDANKLQGQLLGLSQVFVLKDSISSWEMERVIGRKYSCWGGAINIIFPANVSKSPFTRILFKDEIDKISKEEEPLNNKILSIITHRCNGYNKKSHIAPHATRAKRLRDDNKNFREKLSILKENKDYESLFEEALKEIDEQKEVIDDNEANFQEIIQDLEDEKGNILSEKAEIEEKYTRLNSQYNLISNKPSPKIDIGHIMPILYNKLTPESCLDLVKEFFSNNVIILSSAFNSSKKIPSFNNCPRLIFLLYKLCTEYRTKFLEKGDNEAKEVFGINYAANESTTVENNRELCAKRTFIYKGKPIKMFRHLSLGKSRDKNKTLRIHFEVDIQERKIIIGYCGEHLPVKST